MLLAGCSSTSPLIPGIFLISLWYEKYTPTYSTEQVDPGVTQAIANIVGNAQLGVRELNMQLEMRVSQRTVELQVAQAEAERQRARLHHLFMQAPAAICILDGPDLVCELVNPSCQQLFPGRQLVGRLPRHQV